MKIIIVIGIGLNLVFLAGFVVAAPAANFSLSSPEQLDPFYVSLLKKGQNSLLARSYEEAVRDLEIAAFGLAQDKTLQSTAFVYLSIGYFYLKDFVKSEKFIRQAAELMGAEGFTPLGIHESALQDLEKLLVFYSIKLAPTVQSAPASPPAPKDAREINPPAASKTPPKTQSAPEKESTKEAVKDSASPPLITLDKVKEGDLIPLDMVEIMPAAIRRVQPVLPNAARRSDIAGTVVLKALISEKGEVDKIEIIKGIQGALGYNESSIRALRQWKFSPASIKGVKVKVWIPVAFEFKKGE